MYDAADSQRFVLGANYVLTDKAIVLFPNPSPNNIPYPRAGVYDAADSQRFFLGANYVLTDKAIVLFPNPSLNNIPYPRAGVYDAADSQRFFLGANYILTDKATGAVSDSIYVIATSNSSGAARAIPYSALPQPSS